MFSYLKEVIHICFEYIISFHLYFWKTIINCFICFILLSDERMDIEVEKAYKKGLAEERANRVRDMAALNKAIEEKEGRITDLLVKVMYELLNIH